ncbi:MAG TPA: cytochrome c biogenesis protein CcdA [Tepidisphaeraceae bacterium]|nr:cytochrome c biogenesis protein CcdA [Tepidisphaeraceae bacterium]
MRRFFCWPTIYCLILTSTAIAQPKRAAIFTAVNYTSLQPGQQATVAIVLDVSKSFHAQSHTPLADNLIKYEVTFEPNPQIEFGAPIYPKGQLEEYPALGKLSVYAGRTITFVPITVKPNALVGPIQLKGSVTYQICDNRTCFAPETPPILIDTEIVSAGQVLEPNQPELFSSFDPTVFAEDVSLFGWQLTPDRYGLAFFGALIVGMLFNVMPCVLPIVPLKAMGFYQAAQQNRKRSIALGAVFAAGIVATFGGLAIPVVVFRTFAWGELFGNPIFAAGIVIILFLMALGTFGAFSVVLPTRVYQWTPTHETYVGNFLFGILTAILSTPCTFGMFLGLLVWATTQPPVVGTSLIMCVGLGMALPYLILAAFPGLARNFPRTGPWAEIVKQMMGFLLLATAVYFARRFLPDSLGDAGFWWTLFAVIAASGIFLVFRTLQFTRKALPVVVACAIAIIIVAPALAVTLRLTYSPVHWVKYSPEAFKTARESGKPVLLEFTAKWCGNCQAIEATVYVDPRTLETLEKSNVIPMKADLTDRNAPGWDLLRSLHPVGAIPFSAIYLPGNNDPHKLAGLYTTDDLLGTLKGG